MDKPGTTDLDAREASTIRRHEALERNRCKECGAPTGWRSAREYERAQSNFHSLRRQLIAHGIKPDISAHWVDMSPEEV